MNTKRFAYYLKALNGSRIRYNSKKKNCKTENCVLSGNAKEVLIHCHCLVNRRRLDLKFKVKCIDVTKLTVKSKISSSDW